MTLLVGCGGVTTHQNIVPDAVAGSAGTSVATAGAGGSEPAGGMSSAGFGGAPTAGMGGTGGDTSSAGTGGSGGGQFMLPSAGCGKDPGQALGEYVQYSVPLSGETLGMPQVTTTQREIFVRLPPDYDNTKPYRVVYLTPGCGGSGTSSYPLWDDSQSGDPNAIYVGLSRPNPPAAPPSLAECPDNRSGLNSMEWESFDHDHALVSERFCVDNNRIYATTYDGGSGSISDMYSCYFGGIPDPPRKFSPNVALRGAMDVASGTGNGIAVGYPPCNGPVARFWIHDELDYPPNTLTSALEARDRALAQNGCTDGANGPTEPWGEDFFVEGTCLKYTGCPPAYPIVFCTTVGRTHQSNNDNAIPGFNRFMREVEAAAP